MLGRLSDFDPLSLTSFALSVSTREVRALKTPTSSTHICEMIKLSKTENNEIAAFIYSFIFGILRAFYLNNSQRCPVPHWILPRHAALLMPPYFQQLFHSLGPPKLRPEYFHQIFSFLPSTVQQSSFN